MYSIQRASRASVIRTVSIDTIDTKLQKLDQAEKIKAEPLQNFLNDYLQKIKALPRAEIASKQTINKVVACIRRNLQKVETHQINEIKSRLEQLQQTTSDPFHTSSLSNNTSSNTNISKKRGMDSPSLANKRQKFDDESEDGLDNELLIRKSSSGIICKFPDKPLVIKSASIYPANTNYKYGITTDYANFFRCTIIESELKDILFDQPNLNDLKIKLSTLQKIGFYIIEKVTGFDLQNSQLNKVRLVGHAFENKDSMLSSPESWCNGYEFQMSDITCINVIIKYFNLKAAEFNKITGSLNLQHLKVVSSKMQEMNIKQSKWINVSLKNTSFSNNTLTDMTLENFHFNKVDVTFTKIINSKLIGDCIFGSIEYSKLNNLTIQNSQLNFITISKSGLDNCIITQSKLRDSYLSNCTATGSTLENVEFLYSLDNTQDTSFFALKNVDFSNSKISATTISGDNMYFRADNLNFYNSAIRGFCLYHCLIQDSRFDKSTINSAALSDVLFCNTNFSEAKLRDSKFNQVIFSQCNLDKVEISNCSHNNSTDPYVYFTNMNCNFDAISFCCLGDIDNDEEMFEEYFKENDQYKPQQHEVSIKNSNLNIRMDINLSGTIEDNELCLSSFNSSHHKLGIKHNKLAQVVFNSTDFKSCQFFNNEIQELQLTDFKFSKGIFSDLKIHCPIFLGGVIDFYQSKLKNIDIQLSIPKNRNELELEFESSGSSVNITNSRIKQLTMVGIEESESESESESDQSFCTEYQGDITLKEVKGSDIVLKNMNITGNITIKDSNLKLSFSNVILSGELTVINSYVSLRIENCKIKPKANHYTNTEFIITKI